MFKIIIAITILAWPPTASLGAEEDPFPTTGSLGKIEVQIDKIVDSVHRISENVALGQQEISSIGKSFEKEQEKNERLRNSVADIKDRVVIVEISSSTNASKILSMETKFFSFISLLVGVAATAIGAYLKSKATERNTEQAKRIADAHEKSKIG